MIHAIGWLGYESRDFQEQGVGETYVANDGNHKPVEKRPKRVNGVFFGYMHRDLAGAPKETYVATRASYLDINVLLATPVVVDKARHTDGKKMGMKGPYFGDEAAARLISDMIAANPDQEVQLRELATKAGLTLGS